MLPLPQCILTIALRKGKKNVCILHNDLAAIVLFNIKAFK